jgi:enoyl-CoA hydratase/carnithine racemase
MISVEYDGAVAVVNLNQGVTNALSPELVRELADVIAGVGDDSDVQGMVLASSSTRFFSIGFDIPAMFEFSREEFSRFFRGFTHTCLALFTLPKPTVAAITGHAIAGGCILALCCDYRFAAKGRRLMGLNEIKLGLPVPYAADCMLRSIVGGRNAREIMEGGEFYRSEQSLRLGMVDRIFPREQVMVESIEKARLLGAMPGDAFALIKRNRVEMVVTQVLERIEEDEQVFLDRWFAKEARQLLKEAIEKF